MSETVRVELLPLGTAIEVPRGSSLDTVLLPLWGRVPLRRRGHLRRLPGARPARRDPDYSGDARRAAPEEELAAGWRLACWARVAVRGHPRNRAMGNAGSRRQLRFRLRAGAGARDRRRSRHHYHRGATRRRPRPARCCGVETALNPQAAYGADLMTRIEHDLHDPGHTLTRRRPRGHRRDLRPLRRGARSRCCAATR